MLSLELNQLIKHPLPLLIAIDLGHLLHPARDGGVPIEIDVVQELDPLFAQGGLLAALVLTLVFALDVDPARELVRIADAGDVAVSVLRVETLQLSVLK